MSHSGKLIYLASPYSHENPLVRRERFFQIAKVAARLMEQGHILFCPITHTHPITEAGISSTGWEFWQRFDRAMMDRCDEMWIADMPGWQTSVGVNGEIAYMKESAKAIYLLNHTRILNGEEVELGVNFMKYED